MINFKTLFPVLFGLLTCSTAIAKHHAFTGNDPAIGFHQPPPLPMNDWELLIGLDADKRFGNRFVVGLNYQTRLNNNITIFKAALAEVSLRYDLNKFISFKTAFRQGWVTITTTDWHGWERVTGSGTQQRIMFATYLKLKKQDFPIRFQGCLRVENEWMPTFPGGYTFMRVRANVNYNLSKWVDPYVSAESFSDVRATDPLALVRFEAGMKWDIGRGQALHTFYRLEMIDDSFRSKIHVIGLVGT